MRVAISSTGKDLSSLVSKPFGRADYFIIFDTEMSVIVDVIDNSAANMFASGAGVKAASLVANSGVTHVISGNVGPKALQVLEGSSIVIIVGASGTVESVIRNIDTLL